MDKDYYDTLGVPRDASPEEIKSAYRRQAKRLHPDACGETAEDSGNDECFLDVQEAYETLSDRERRRAYDVRADRARGASARQPGAAPLWRQMIWESPPESLRSTRSSQTPRPVEPLIPESQADQEWGWALGWSDWDEWVDPADVKVELTLEQARFGGWVEVRLPIDRPCPTCGGQGGRGFTMCSRCAGRGRIVDQRRLRLSFPGGIADGDMARVTLDGAGIPGAELVVRFVVSGW